jgi:hypothetical protein
MSRFEEGGLQRSEVRASDVRWNYLGSPNMKS